MAGDLGQVVGQQPTAPQGTVHPDLAGVQVGDPDQLLLPGGRIVRWLPRMWPVRDRVGPTGQVAAQHPPDGIGAAAGEGSDLGGAVALGRQQHHLVAGTGLGVTGGPVALIEFRMSLLIQVHPHWRRHDRPPVQHKD